jgi:hypothetical protein
VATVSGTGAFNEIPETRYYVITHVNEWGQESAPSFASNQVEVAFGQIVTLTNFPVLPTGGQYNITSRRIYRTSSSSTSGATFLLVGEVKTSADAYLVATSVGIARPNALVTFGSAHGLKAGDFVTASGNFGHFNPEKSMTSITYGATTTVIASTTHGLLNGEGVRFYGFNAVSGAMELEGVASYITYIDADSFSLDVYDGVDTTGYSAWDPLTQGLYQQTYGLDSLMNRSPLVLSAPTTTTILISEDVGAGILLHPDGDISFRQSAGTTYIDGIYSSELGSGLQTATSDPPNAATIGLRTHPGGFLVGYFGASLCYSEQGAPHSWPLDYRRGTSSNITGIEIFGNYVYVGTESFGYIAYGDAPGSMAMQELSANQACMSQRAMVDVGNGVVYPSPDGLVLVSQAGAQLLTETIFTREQWQAMNPSSMLAFLWEKQYLCFFGDGTNSVNAFSISFSNPGEGVRHYTTWASGGFKEVEEDRLYLVINNEIVAWNAGTATTTTKYTTRPIRMLKPVNFSYCKVEADDFPVTLDIYADGVIRATETVQDNKIFRLRGGYVASEYKVRIRSKHLVSDVTVSQTMREMSTNV